MAAEIAPRRGNAGQRLFGGYAARRGRVANCEATIHWRTSAQRVSTKCSGLTRYRPQAIAEPAAPPKVAPPPTAQSCPVPDPIAAPATPPTTAPPTVPATQPGVAGAVVEYMFADWHPANAKHDAAMITIVEQLGISSSYRCFRRLMVSEFPTKRQRRYGPGSTTLTQ